MYLLLRNYFICTAKFLLFYNGGRIYQLGSFLFVLQKSLHFWMLEKYATWIYFICTAKVLTFLDSEGICYKLQQTLQLVTNIQIATNIYKLWQTQKKKGNKKMWIQILALFIFLLWFRSQCCLTVNQFVNNNNLDSEYSSS